jgi:GntR family transcriptional regulator
MMSTKQPRYQQATDSLTELLKSMEPGTFLPSEPKLARELGVSRATLREAMRTFEGLGLIVRRQGVGTYITNPPQVIDTGLEELESIEHLAERIGLKVSSGDIEIQEKNPTEDEIEKFGVGSDAQVIAISRVMYTDNRPIAYLVDTLPPGRVPEGVYDEHFRGSVLDQILDQGNLEIGHSHTDITAVAASHDVARKLGVQRGDVIMAFEGWLHTRDGHVIDHSMSYFLPGTFRFHIVRRVNSTH